MKLVPLLDEVALAKWDKAYSRESRKVSNRALVYAEDTRGNFLLIFILDELTAQPMILPKCVRPNISS